MAIDAAAGKLHAGKPSEAVKPQTDVVEKFNQMYRSVVAVSEPGGPGGGHAARAGGCKVPLSPPGEGRGEGAKDRRKGRKRRLSERNKALTPCPSPASGEGPVVRASKEAAWNQEFVTRYGEILAPLAKEGLKQLEATPAAAGRLRHAAGQAGQPLVLHRRRRTPETARRSQAIHGEGRGTGAQSREALGRGGRNCFAIANRPRPCQNSRKP